MLETTAQLIVVDPEEITKEQEMTLVPLEVCSPHEHEHEVSLPEGEIILEVSDIPGAPHGTHDPEEPLEVEEKDSKEEDKKDDNDAAKSKKNEKWDWANKGAHGFLLWVKERYESVPSHSGYDAAGLERAISYLEKLDNEISKAMRLDLDGELDADKVEKIRSRIDDDLARMYDRLDKLKKSSKRKRSKRGETEHGLIKEGQKITGVQGIYVVVPLFISMIGRLCINGMVSAGHDLGRMYHEQSKKWKLTEREQAELLQFLSDCGYQTRMDRGHSPDMHDVDTASSDNSDWAANYRA